MMKIKTFLVFQLTRQHLKGITQNHINKGLIVFVVFIRHLSNQLFDKCLYKLYQNMFFRISFTNRLFKRCYTYIQ